MKKSAAALKQPDRVRFWGKVNKTSTCWIWTAATNTDGYGHFHVASEGRRITLRAHRVSYELLRGPIPDGTCLDHLCRVRECVNPDHLDVVTGAVNTLRGISSPAINSRKTCCQRGHEFTVANTRINRRGERICRACERERHRRRRSALRGAA